MINPSLHLPLSLLPLSLACLLLTGCGVDSKPTIPSPDQPTKPTTPKPDTQPPTPPVIITALITDLSIEKAENGSYRSDDKGVAFCPPSAQQACGLLTFSVTADLQTILSINDDKPITIDYRLVSPQGDVAQILKDPAQVSGVITLHKNAIQTTLSFPLKTDNQATGDWQITLNLSNAKGGASLDNINSSLVTATVKDPQKPATLPNNPNAKINGTGIQFSGKTVGNDPTCQPDTEQDCQQGQAVFQWVKLNHDGKELPASASDWSCIKDKTTGLTWERKSYAKQNADKNYRDAKWEYAYYDKTTSLGKQATTDGTKDCGIQQCTTQGYLDKLNSDRQCGISTWRLPSRIELFDMVNLGGLNAQQTMHADWLFSPKQLADYDRSWKMYDLPSSFWTSSVAAKFTTHDGYSSPSSLKFNHIWVMFTDGTLDTANPDSSYQTAAVLAVAK